MSKRRITLVAVTCLLVGIFAGVGGAQILQYKIANSGLATVKDSETIQFHFTLDDAAGTPPAVVSMQLLNETDSFVKPTDTLVMLGQHERSANQVQRRLRGYAIGDPDRQPHVE